jgi:type II secretory pathway pseudopilin PulG
MQNHASRTTHHASLQAFTMIEIAFSLAIIGFALVAIIGVLPIGMNVQKDNREQTIINQDATMFMDAIRSGAQGMDDLTNYVVAITNWSTLCNANGTPQRTHIYGYTFSGSTVDGASDSPPFPITSGSRIVGLLSTPKYDPPPNGNITYYSNHVVAYVRSLSGPANEKFPQDNSSVQDFSFSYLMTSEIVPYYTNYFDPSWANTNQPGLTAIDIVTRSNYWTVAQNIQANLHDVRLAFRWPLRSQGQSGSSGQSFRTLVGGQLFSFLETNYPARLEYSNYFFQSRTYVKAP